MGVSAAEFRQSTVAKAACARDVVQRLEEAGATLLKLPANARQRGALVLDERDFPTVRLTAAPAEIDRMDEALAWISLIQRDRYVLRRIVGARSLVSPITGKHLYSWRRMSTLLGVDQKTVQRWHAQGIALIVAALQERKP